MNFTRRAFVQGLMASAGASTVFGSAVVSAEVQPGLNHDRDDEDNKKGGADFLHGVASGDPLADRLIVWTRLTPTRENRSPLTIPVSWEVSLDPEFTSIIRSGRTRAYRWRDYTIKIDLVDLAPNTEYFYRFKSRSSESPVGRGKTLPIGEVSKVKLAVMSCSNFPAGYFNVYQDASQIPDLDAVCHLGDYIYEYGEGGYATELADQIGRGFEPNNAGELFSLKDYRKRYAQYRTDEGCQALHAHAPFICVWDDHEVANDAWREGAENHNEGEGSFRRRKLAAIRAYYEWMPIRPPSKRFSSEEIYRRFDFGDLLTLHMLDTRIVGRDEQLDYADYINPLDGSFDVAAFTADVTDPNRTILGAEQLQWLTDGMNQSSAIWQVLGQQVLMGRMTIPAELLAGLANPGPELFLVIQELATIKARILAGDPTVTDAERGRVETTIPYNLDAWDGYFFEREAIFGTALAANKNLVALAGDTHNGWGNNLTGLFGEKVGVEFATASVSSPGLEAILSLDDTTVQGAEAAIGILIDGLKYLNLKDRGYLVVNFTPEEAVAEWIYLDNILDTDYETLDDRARQLKVRPGPSGRMLEEV